MPFILCSTICCCLPCIISILGVREDLTQNRGATSESINALPVYKFKMKKNKRSGENNNGNIEGGVVAAGTAKERVISGEDAVNTILYLFRNFVTSWHYLSSHIISSYMSKKSLCIKRYMSNQTSVTLGFWRNNFRIVVYIICTHILNSVFCSVSGMDSHGILKTFLAIGY